MRQIIIISFTAVCILDLWLLYLHPYEDNFFHRGVYTNSFFPRRVAKNSDLYLSQHLVRLESLTDYWFSKPYFAKEEKYYLTITTFSLIGYQNNESKMQMCCFFENNYIFINNSFALLCLGDQRKYHFFSRGFKQALKSGSIWWVKTSLKHTQFNEWK